MNELRLVHAQLQRGGFACRVCARGVSLRVHGERKLVPKLVHDFLDDAGAEPLARLFCDTRKPLLEHQRLARDPHPVVLHADADVLVASAARPVREVVVVQRALALVEGEQRVVVRLVRPGVLREAGARPRLHRAADVADVRAVETVEEPRVVGQHIPTIVTLRRHRLGDTRRPPRRTDSERPVGPASLRAFARLPPRPRARARRLQ